MRIASTYRIALALMLLLFMAGTSHALIPEPDNIIYGQAKLSGIPLTAAHTKFTVTLEVDAGKPIASYTMGQQSSAGDNYVLSVPLDVLDPQLPNTARSGDTATIYLNGSAAGRVSIGERGALINMDINVLDASDADGDGLPDIFEDTNSDGDPSNDDRDGDGIADYLDDDDDGDGKPTMAEDWNRDGNPMNDDCDEDGIADYLDPENICDEPYMELIVEDFETGDLSKLPWQTKVSGATVSWEIQDDSTNQINPDTTSRFVLKSSELDHNQSAAITITMFCEEGDIVFDYAIDSDQDYDHLNFYIDGINQNDSDGHEDDEEYNANWSGYIALRTQSYPVAAGLHTFTWEFEKDEMDYCDYYPNDPLCAEFQDTVWIDNIIFPRSLDSDDDGMPDSWEATHGVTDANVDDDGDGFLNGVECLYDTDPTSGGVYPTVPEISEGFETGDLTHLPWTLSGDGNWNIRVEPVHDGNYAVASADIDANQRTVLETSVYCDPGSVHFWSAISSEVAIDKLIFYIDGVQLDAWSGDYRDFTQSDSYDVVDSGMHTFTWEYAKNWRDDVGQDKAWIDDITFPGYLDFDNDGMPDSWEVLTGLNPIFDDALGDPDEDGVSNYDEFFAGTNPTSAIDVDGDALLDSTEEETDSN